MLCPLPQPLQPTRLQSGQSSLRNPHPQICQDICTSSPARQDTPDPAVGPQYPRHNPPSSRASLGLQTDHKCTWSLAQSCQDSGLGDTGPGQSGFQKCESLLPDPGSQPSPAHARGSQGEVPGAGSSSPTQPLSPFRSAPSWHFCFSDSSSQPAPPNFSLPEVQGRAAPPTRPAWLRLRPAWLRPRPRGAWSPSARGGGPCRGASRLQWRRASTGAQQGMLPAWLLAGTRRGMGC